MQIVQQAWGPRPGGPPIPPPPPTPPSRPVGVLITLGLFGLSGLGSGSGGGVLFGLICLGIGGYILSRPHLQKLEVDRQQQAHKDLLQQWWDTRPVAIVARSQDALVAARDIATTAGSNGGAFLGITPDDREWITADREQAVLVLGPPRSGKTTALIIPSILSAPGPVVSTSTKADVLQATFRSRSRFGRVWLFDPSGTEAVPSGVIELQWSPVASSRTWDKARAMADAMVSASPAGAAVENATYWTESAKALLGPLLHAAALDGRTIADVRRWVLRSNFEEPGRILEAQGAELAADDVERIAHTEDRERSSIVATTASVLGAYGSEAALARCASPNFSAAKFVRSTDTIYITAPSHLQGLLAPLVVGLLEEIRDETYRLARETAGRRDAAQPSVFWALDEIANIAPLKNLPGIVSEAGGQGLHVMACFQDLSQAEVRWGKASDGFLTLFGTKVIFPSIGDGKTLEALSRMVGDWDRPYVVKDTSTGYTKSFPSPSSTTTTSHSYSTQREALLSPSEVSNIPQGHALMVRSGKWGVLECTPHYSAEPWRTVLAQAPSAVSNTSESDELILAAERPEAPKLSKPRRPSGAPKRTSASSTRAGQATSPARRSPPLNGSRKRTAPVRKKPAD